MDMNMPKETGSLNISEAVIEKIAQLVVDDVDGVYSMASSPTYMKDLVFRSQRNKPIRIKLNSGVAEIDLYLIVKNGYKIKDVAESVQKYVKETVQNMTSIAVSKVNVYVQGVQVDEQ
jgi:uncharacterized alkaline shock family protein YloU